jgi:hypothetical protein
MSTPSDKPHEVSSEEFRKDRALVFELAASGRRVVVTDDDRQPTTILAVPRDKLPMRFD